MSANSEDEPEAEDVDLSHWQRDIGCAGEPRSNVHQARQQPESVPLQQASGQRTCERPVDESPGLSQEELDGLAVHHSHQRRSVVLRTTVEGHDLEIKYLSQWCDDMEDVLATVFQQGTPSCAFVIDANGRQRDVPLYQPPWDTMVDDLLFPLTLRYVMDDTCVDLAQVRQEFEELLYLPKRLNGKTVLVQRDVNTYLVDRSQLHVDTEGVAYRSAPKLDAKLEHFVPWGSIVEGIDVGDGWIRFVRYSS